MTVKKQWVFMGDGEFGNDLMLSAAKEAVAKREQTPILVMVTEHGGWWLQYYFDDKYPHGIIVGTANDSARFSNEVTQVRERLASPSTSYETFPNIKRKSSLVDFNYLPQT